jgi:hypothetical protein
MPFAWQITPRRVSEERLFPFLSMCSKLFREFQKRIIEHQFQTSSRISYRIGYMPLLTSFLPVLHSGTFSPTAEVLTFSVNATWQFQLPNSSKMTLCFMGSQVHPVVPRFTNRAWIPCMASVPTVLLGFRYYAISICLGTGVQKPQGGRVQESMFNILPHFNSVK